MSIEVNIGNGIYISNMTTNATISNGENSQFGWSSHQKKNYSFYTTGFSSHLSFNKCVIIDNDEIDTIILNDNMMQGTTSQQY